ncbi:MULTISPECIES: heme exporter protein CcmD [unclassified Bradyrhizobium]|uniref:heme exporter protein CcmD n=2 Tax=Bradyrhizobium TaxID=374 RepID=UPI002011807C|nr:MULTISPECIES: heme exporter protein CcmD [unclassified Bradyrhizobium]
MSAAMFGPYTSFIVASYAVAAIVVVALVAWVIADHRRQQRLLRDLEASGVTRRSGREAA